jgi:hypothetical protein
VMAGSIMFRVGVKRPLFAAADAAFQRPGERGSLLCLAARVKFTWVAETFFIAGYLADCLLR